MKYYINYSDKAFIKQQNFALKMAKLKGGFDSIEGYSREGIDKVFYQKNQKILEQPRGGGYWLWKPYFISKKLAELNNGDYLFYSDSGAFFIKSVDILIEELEKSKQDVMGFELPLIEKQWTKKELLINMDCNSNFYTESNQILASYILIRKTKLSVKFFQEYLNYASSELNITDKYDNSVIQDDIFIEHRHDQSIFSLLYKKYKFKPFKDPSQLGKYPRGYSASFEDQVEVGKVHRLQNGRLFRYFEYKEKYENILYHNRKGDPLFSFVKFKVKELLYTLGLYKGLVR